MNAYQNRAQNFAGDDIARDSSGRRNRILAKDVAIGADLHLQTTIRTEPAGALVVLGDHAQKSPATFADLEPRNNLRIMSLGYEPVETSVDFRSQTVTRSAAISTCAKQRCSPNPIRTIRGAVFNVSDGQVSREGVTPANRS